MVAVGRGAPLARVAMDTPSGTSLMDAARGLHFQRLVNAWLVLCRMASPSNKADEEGST